MHLVDVYAAYVADGRGTAVLVSGDGVHPSTEGKAVATATVVADFDAA
jgi:hypothetical protein